MYLIWSMMFCIARSHKQLLLTTRHFWPDKTPRIEMGHCLCAAWYSSFECGNSVSMRANQTEHSVYESYLFDVLVYDRHTCITIPHSWLITGCVTHKWPRICSTCRKQFPAFPQSFMTCHRVCNYITRRVPLVEQKLLTLPEHLSSPPVFSGVRVTRSFYMYVL